MEAAGQALVFSRRFVDAEEMALAIRDAGVDYVPLDAGPFESRLTVLQFGPLLLQRARDRAHVARGTLNPGRIGLLAPISHLLPPTVNGCTLGPGDMLALSPGCELHGFCPAAVEWISLSLPMEIAGSLLEPGTISSIERRAEHTWFVPPNSAAQVRMAITAITDLAESLPEAVAVPRAAEAVAHGLMDLCMDAFLKAQCHLVPSRATRNVIRLVNAAEDYLQMNIARPIYTSELCAVLAVSPRKLHQAFVAACGMSPQAYLKRRRLMMVHRVLRSGAPDAPLVKSVALAHGFWHLGNFAHDYRALFGQSPSETLSLGRLGANRH